MLIEIKQDLALRDEDAAIAAQGSEYKRIPCPAKQDLCRSAQRDDPVIRRLPESDVKN